MSRYVRDPTDKLLR